MSSLGGLTTGYRRTLTSGGDDRLVVISVWLSLSTLVVVRSWKPRRWRRLRDEPPTAPRHLSVVPPNDPEPAPKEGDEEEVSVDDAVLVEVRSGAMWLADGLSAASHGRIRLRRYGERRDALLIGPMPPDLVRELREECGPDEVIVTVDGRTVLTPSAIAETFRAGASDVIAGPELPVVVARLEALFRRRRG